MALLDPDDRIVRFVEKPSQPIGSNWLDAALYLCDAALLELLPSRTPIDSGLDVIRALIGSGRCVQGLRMRAQETLVWIYTPADLAQARSIYG